MGPSPVRALLTIEASFVYESSGGTFELDPPRVETLDQVWRFLRRRIVDAHCDSFEAPVLSLSFDDDSHFLSQPIPQYEAFHLTGEGVPGLLAGPV